jgi:hypothetical protein
MRKATNSMGLVEYGGKEARKSLHAFPPVVGHGLANLSKLDAPIFRRPNRPQPAPRVPMSAFGCSARSGT